MGCSARGRAEGANVNDAHPPDAPGGLVERTRQLVAERISASLGALQPPLDLEVLLPGKMLRTHLVQHLLGQMPGDMDTLCRGCAAVEIVHTASLCHDDVIDGGLLRRGVASLWRQAGAPAAVLVGDILLCESIAVASEMDEPATLRRFLQAIQLTCAAEAEHELLLHSRRLDEPTCLRLARGKTGSLFGFAAWLCRRDEPAAAAALWETGQRIGTLYQIADDLLDVLGREELCGKTLGTDRQRGKTTLAGQSVDVASARLRELQEAAVGPLADWPELQAGAQRFIEESIASVWSQLPRLPQHVSPQRGQ